MTEREYYRETDATPAASRREVYQQTVVDHTGALAADEVARDVYQEHVYGPAGEQVVRSEHVSVPSAATRRTATVSRINQVIYFVFGVVNVLLALRFVLLLLGASEASPFVRLIYGLSGPFAAPFQGIFGEPVLGTSVVEWASLVGIIIYMLLAYGLTRLIALIYAPAYATADER
jgi:hypothetical protein